jgi:heat shock protein HslJ
MLQMDFFQKKEKINLQPPVSTKMHCAGKMEIENILNKILPEITEIERSAENLFYLKNDKEVLLTIKKEISE